MLPIALRQALPAYGNEMVIMVKSTSLASIVTLMEVTGIAYAIISETYRALEVFLCAGAIYLTLNFLLTRAIGLAGTPAQPASAPGARRDGRGHRRRGHAACTSVSAR